MGVRVVLQVVAWSVDFVPVLVGTSIGLFLLISLSLVLEAKLVARVFCDLLPVDKGRCSVEFVIDISLIDKILGDDINMLALLVHFGERDHGDCLGRVW